MEPSSGNGFLQKFGFRLLVALASIFLFLGLVSIVLPEGWAKQAPLPGLTGWEINIEFDEKDDPNRERFCGSFKIGDPLFAPPGKWLEIQSIIKDSSDQTAMGHFESHSKSRWEFHGGEFETKLIRDKTGRWIQRLKAPNKTGTYTLQWQWNGIRTEEKLPKLSIFVMQEAKVEKKGNKFRVSINNETIGNWPSTKSISDEKMKNVRSTYEPPRYFVRITDKTKDFSLGCGLTLEQMVSLPSKWVDGKKIYLPNPHTKWVPPHPKLFHKLRKLREQLKERGFPDVKYWVESGFRTPEYNEGVGGSTYSRHCYGDGIDICIDDNQDRQMDDINGDGKRNKDDGIVLAEALAKMEIQGMVVKGGIGAYGWTKKESLRSHVHLDCRTYTARWGQIDSGKNKKKFVWWMKGDTIGSLK